MENKFSILSWNVHLNTFAEDNQYVVDVIKSAGKPDIVCLQEYVEGVDPNTKNWLTSNNYTLAYLPFAEFPKNKSLSQGLLIAVKKSLNVDFEKVVLRKDEPRRFRNFPNIRGVIKCTIKKSNGSTLDIINAHSTFARPYTIDMRKKEFSKLVKYLDTRTNNPMILCGDFNFLPLDSKRKYMKNKFNYFSGSIINPTWKHDYKLSPFRANLDYIFWNKDLLNVSSKLLPFNVSDHRPIFTEVIF